MRAARGRRGSGERSAAMLPRRDRGSGTRLSTRFASCSPNLWISGTVPTPVGIVRNASSARIAAMMRAVLAQRRLDGGVQPCRRTRSGSTASSRCARNRELGGGDGAHRAAARARQADRARAARPAARRGLVRRARRVRHAPRRPTSAIDEQRSSATASSPATARSTAGSSSSSARTSRSSAARCPRRTPRRSARSWTWR